MTSADKLRVRMRVRFDAGTQHAMHDCFLDLGGLLGTVVEVGPAQVWVKLDSDEFATELAEWENCIEYYEGDDFSTLPFEVLP